MKVSSKTEIDRVKESILGLTVVSMKENGFVIK